MTAHAVIIGAGIGGLAAAAGLQQAGWEVTVCERAAALEPVGAGLAVAPNGLRALDVLGAADEIQSLAIAQEPGIRRRDGRWLARSSGRMVAARFGDPVVLLARTALVEALLDRISGPAIRLSTPVTAVEPGGPSRSALVTTTAGDLDADLVVAADGIRSGIRASLFPDPGPDVARRSRRIAAMATRTAPLAVAARDAMVLAIGRLMPGAALRCAAKPRTRPRLASSAAAALLAVRFGQADHAVPVTLARIRSVIWFASSSVISMKSFSRSPRSAETRDVLYSHRRFLVNASSDRPPSSK